MASPPPPRPLSTPPPKAPVTALVLSLAACAWLLGGLSLAAFRSHFRGATALVAVSAAISLLAAGWVGRRLRKLLVLPTPPPAPPPVPIAEPAPRVDKPPAPPPLVITPAPPSTHTPMELLASLSQEFRTPLNGILGMSGFLLEEELSPDSRHFGQSIERSAESLLAIINDIVDFAKLEAGEMELEPLVFNPRHTLEDVLESVAPQAEAKHLDLVALFEAAVPEWVEGDPGCIRQVLLNLLGNALAFTERGGVVVHLGLNPDGKLQFEVRDSGVGMDEALLPRLFHPTPHGDHASARRSAGSGLGLAISRALVELMGGTIGVESRPGAGSRFWFTAALKLCAGPAPGPNLQAPPQPAGPGAPPLKILLAGPSTGSLRTLESHLKQLGFDLRRCGGAETLDTGTVRGFDLVILAPEGPELAALLARARNLREAHAPPLVLYSTFVQRGQGRLAHQAGLAGFLCRPLRASHVQAVVTGVLQGHPFLVTRHQFEERQVSAHRPVLVMEARPEEQLQACRLLQKAGWKPYWTRDGQGALEAVQQRLYDFVLMDCSQADYGGLEATRLLRAGGIKVPIIGLIAATADREKPEILAAGLNATLTKPIRPADLAAIMERFHPRR